MLKDLHDPSVTSVAIKEAEFPSPFFHGLQYAAPARGVWNIAHTGMLLPGSHEIFICAEGCLRGVVLTAAEMGEESRFSQVEITEDDVLNGTMESLFVDGIDDILKRLPSIPKVVLVFTSCIHHVMSCDLPHMYTEIRRRYPIVKFIPCFMTPLMRESGLDPDQLMRRALYEALDPLPLEAKSVNIIGNDLPTDETSDLASLIRESGFTLRDITRCTTYDDYLAMAKASINITTNPSAIPSGEALERRFGQHHLHLEQCWLNENIERENRKLADALKVPLDKALQKKRRDDAEEALNQLERKLKGVFVAVDYTAVWHPLELSLLLLQHGIAVRTVYLDAIPKYEKESFEQLKEQYPNLVLRPTIDPAMRMVRREELNTLCVGQKAAYFTGSRHFVNQVEGGGLFGYDGVVRLCERMTDALNTEKDPAKEIQPKGLGCRCCL